MIPIPSIPTDSFYKFCFVGGLFLFSLAMYFNFKTEELKTDTSIANKRISRVIGIDSALDARARKLDSLRGISYVSIDKANVKVGEKFTERPIDTASIKRMQLLSEQIDENQIKIQNLISYTFTMYICFIFSVLLIIYGGYSWYHKVQKLQDELLELQVQSVKNDLEKAKNNADEATN